MYKHYVFDFDGVLFQTARECLALAYRAARKNSHQWEFAKAWKEHETPPDHVESIFLKRRYWVGPPWQYSVLLRCIAEGEVPTKTVDFLTLASTLKADHEPFTEHYFAERAHLSRDQSAWFSLMEPVPGVTFRFAELLQKGQAYLLSTRDGDSIRKIIREFLGVEIPPGALLPRSGPKEKWELLNDFIEEKGARPEDVFFLDDYVTHLLPAHERGYKAHLASWGYLGDEDMEAAKSAGLPILKREDRIP